MLSEFLEIFAIFILGIRDIFKYGIFDTGTPFQGLIYLPMNFSVDISYSACVMLQTK